MGPDRLRLASAIFALTVTVAGCSSEPPIIKLTKVPTSTTTPDKTSTTQVFIGGVNSEKCNTYDIYRSPSLEKGGTSNVGIEVPCHTEVEVNGTYGGDKICVRSGRVAGWINAKWLRDSNDENLPKDFFLRKKALASTECRDFDGIPSQLAVYGAIVSSDR